MRKAMLVVLFLAAPVCAADDKPTVREIPLKGLKVTFSENAALFTEIKSGEELAKSEALKDAADAIQKQVDFAKEKLVFFAWSGSGGDKITPDEKTPGTFRFTKGKTKDLRRHMHLWVVPKAAPVKIVTGK